jgi:FkbM family methyltransferase
MNIKCISEHTFDVDLFDKNYPVLDVGCRYFDLNNIKNYGIDIVCIDPDPQVKPKNTSIKFANIALSIKNGEMNLATFGNGTGNFIISKDQPNSGYGFIKVQTMDILTIMKYFSISKWSAVKLDCEGSEYDILMNWPGPISNQISVEFHEHSIPKQHTNEYFNQLIKYLSTWYNPPINFKKEKRHCLSIPNYWDVLFTIKGK